LLNYRLQVPQESDRQRQEPLTKSHKLWEKLIERIETHAKEYNVKRAHPERRQMTIV
jgi:hypothetical protein